LEWIHEVFDYYRRTIQLAGVDTEDVVAFTKHNGAVTCSSPYEAAAKPHVHLAINTPLSCRAADDSVI